MDQHPMPRQITTFEFKLIGFLTLKQFIYLVIFVPLGFIVYKLFPLPLVNILLAVLIGGMGAAFAFLPVNERPLDVWIRNLTKRLTSPTQYVYKKSNQPVYFLQNLFFVSDPHRALAHIESQEKLAAYLAMSKKRKVEKTKESRVSQLLKGVPPVAKNQVPPAEKKEAPPEKQTESQTHQPKPFLSGLVKNHKLIPLPGILIYVKDEKGSLVRLLKSNPHGVFATFNPLPKSEYQFETRDPKNNYFFDTMKIGIEDDNPKPIEIFSKELL